MTNSELIITLDFDEMLYKLSSDESLAKDEIIALEHFISTQVKAPREKRPLEDLYAALKVVSKSNSPKLSYLVEMCLDLSDPLIICLALEILITQWNLGNQYEERLIQFTLGIPSDHDNDIKECAIKCISSHLSKSKLSTKLKSIKPSEARFLNLFLEILGDDKEDEYIKETTFNSLLKIFKLSPEDLPDEEEKDNILVYLERSIIIEIKNQLKRLSSSSSLELDNDFTSSEFSSSSKSESGFPESGTR